MGIRSWLSEGGGVITALRLGKDKGTTRPLGWGHVQFATASEAKAAVERCDNKEFHGRILRAAFVRPDEKFQFALPEEIKNDLRAILSEGYEGKNLSTIKDAWQKRHPGQKLDASKWGFKNFSSAVATIDGIILETHPEKKLTRLPFLVGSKAHEVYNEAKQQRASSEEVVQESRGEKRPASSGEAGDANLDSGQAAKKQRSTSADESPEIVTEGQASTGLDVGRPRMECTEASSPVHEAECTEASSPVHEAVSQTDAPPVSIPARGVPAGALPLDSDASVVAATRRCNACIIS